jgi:CCR4-NOT complex subunit CAF16
MVPNAIQIHGLTFAYPAHPQPVLSAIDWELPTGARCLLAGSNGAGKTTLLAILAGRFLVDGEQVRVLGRPAFHDTTLTAHRQLLGGTFPLDVDITVDEMLATKPAEPARLARLLEVLEIDRSWHMHRVSDGQRRRVQLLLGLLRPSELLLLDEVTTDLDLIARSDLLAFLKREGATIVYATHIFDGLDAWATHIAYLERGRLIKMEAMADVPKPLSPTVESWMRATAARR